jgi:hypothetical protein
MFSVFERVGEFHFMKGRSLVAAKISAAYGMAGRDEPVPERFWRCREVLEIGRVFLEEKVT